MFEAAVGAVAGSEVGIAVDVAAAAAAVAAASADTQRKLAASVSVSVQAQAQENERRVWFERRANEEAQTGRSSYSREERAAGVGDGGGIAAAAVVAAAGRCRHTQGTAHIRSPAYSSE